jgi:hypothetical protein
MTDYKKVRASFGKHSPDRAASVRNDRICGASKYSRLTFAAIVVSLASVVSGCVNSQIAAGRAALEKGDYSAAHAKFVAAEHSKKLSKSERRELADGLCLTEFKLGAPEYPRPQQWQTCSNAAAQSGSASGPIVSSIDAAEHAETAKAVDSALKDHDVASAQNAVVKYQTFPGADRSAIVGWSKQIWASIDQQEKHGKNHDRHIASAVSAISQRYPKMHSMNDVAFTRWVISNGKVSHTNLVDRVELRENTLDLHVASHNLPAIAFNLDHFIMISDGMVARCHCDGRTNIAVEGSGLPAYLLRVDPDTRKSAALVMPQPY